MPFDTTGKVKEFIEAFDAKPDWVSLIIEESKEVNEAAANLFKEVVDLIYVAEGASLANVNVDNLMPNDDVYAATKWIYELCNLFSSKVREEAFNRVHQSNMSKLGDDGKPIRREDGKILKGPNYKPPVLTDLASQVGDDLDNNI